MKTTLRNTLVIATTICLFISTAYAQQSGKKEHVFRGKVEKVDAQSKTLTVDGEKVEGWMSAMKMNYTVDNPDAIKNIKPGDQITAKVYDGDFKILHEVKVVPADKTGAQPPSKK